MNNLFNLIKVMFKTDDLLQLNIEKGGPLKKKILTAIFAILMIVCGFSFSPIVGEVYDLLKPFGFEFVIVKLILLFASFLTVYFAFLFIMNAFYFSQDVENYLYLPIKQGDIVISKLVMVTFFEILSTLVLFYPSLIVYGKISNSPLSFYLKSFLAMALVPIIPMAIIGIICILIMKNSKLFKNKDNFTNIMGFIGIFFGVGISFLGQKVGMTSFNGKLPPLFTGEGFAGKVLEFLFPSAMVLSKGIKNNTFFINFALVLVITSIVLYVFYLVGNKYYFDGARGLNESGSLRTELSKKELRSKSIKNSPLITLALKELKVLLRTPSYLMNGVLSTIMIPFFLAIPIFSGNDEFRKLILKMDMNKLNLSNSLIILIMTLIMFTFACVNLMSSTSISREGKDFFFMKYIPVPYKTQILAKILPPLVINNVFLFIIFILINKILKIDIKILLLGYLCGLVVSLAGYLLSTIADIIRPNLTWVSEIKAIKQNFNPFFTFILGGGLSFLFGYGAIKLNINPNTLLMLILGSSIIFIVVYYFNLDKFVKRAFRDLN